MNLKLIAARAQDIAERLTYAGFTTSVDEVTQRLIQLSGVPDAAAENARNMLDVFPKEARKVAQWKSERRNYLSRR